MAIGEHRPKPPSLFRHGFGTGRRLSESVYGFGPPNFGTFPDGTIYWKHLQVICFCYWAVVVVVEPNEDFTQFV